MARNQHAIPKNASVSIWVEYRNIPSRIEPKWSRYGLRLGVSPTDMTRIPSTDVMRRRYCDQDLSERLE